MRNLITTILVITTVSYASWAQNIGINSTGNTPDQSAGLDIDFNDKERLPDHVLDELIQHFST